MRGDVPCRLPRSSTLNSLNRPGTYHSLEMYVVGSTGFWQGQAMQLYVSTCEVGPPECHESLRAGAPVTPAGTRPRPQKRK